MAPAGPAVRGIRPAPGAAGEVRIIVLSTAAMKVMVSEVARVGETGGATLARNHCTAWAQYELVNSRVRSQCGAAVKVTSSLGPPRRAKLWTTISYGHTPSFSEATTWIGVRHSSKATLGANPPTAARMSSGASAWGPNGSSRRVPTSVESWAPAK